MELYQLMMENLPYKMYADLILRLVIACFCGIAVGLERTKRQKAAGIRTHGLIAATAALLMILSKYAFADLTLADGVTMFAGTKGADPARIAAGVVSGVTFLGAGVIFVKGGSVRGLTTAAGIWATSAVGLAIGAGMYLVGVLFTALIVGLQVILHQLNVGDDAFSTHEIVVEMKDTVENREAISDIFVLHGIQVLESKISREPDDYISLRLTVKMTSYISFEESMEFLDNHPGIRSLAL